MMNFLIIEFLSCGIVVCCDYRPAKYFFSLENSSNNNLWYLDLIPMKFWSTSGDNLTTSNSVKADFKARSNYTASPTPPPTPPLSHPQSSYILSIRCPTSYTPPTCNSQHDELLSLSSFVQGDDADSPLVLRSYPYNENS